MIYPISLNHKIIERIFIILGKQVEYQKEKKLLLAGENEV